MENAYNTLWLGAFAWPDYDMFQSHDPDAGFHALARAMSGGPVYLTDEPGKERPEVIRPLAGADGWLYRLDAPGQVTRDLLFVDPTREPVALKIADEIRSANGFLQNGNAGISGTDRMIALQTVVLPDKEMFEERTIRDVALPGQSDIRQVHYYLAYDDEETHDYPDGTSGPKPLGLVRREVKTLNQAVVDEERQVVRGEPDVAALPALA